MLMVGEMPIQEGYILLEGSTDRVLLEGGDGLVLLEEPSHNILLEGGDGIITLEGGDGNIEQEH